MVLMKYYRTIYSKPGKKVLPFSKGRCPKDRGV
jgi:hypothetical protein